MTLVAGSPPPQSQVTDPAFAVEAMVTAVIVERGDRMAVSAPDGELSYAELDACADRLADVLHAEGVGTGSLVALCLPRSAALVVAQWAVMKVKATYLPVDPAWPERRAREVIAASGAGHLVVADGHAGGFAGDPVASMPGTGRLLRLRRGSRRTELEGLAYVMYTSGSTGEPKGVMVERAGLANLVRWHLDAFDLTATDRCMQLSSPGFDASAWEIWTTLAAGASLHVPVPGLRTAPDGLRDWLLNAGITVGFVPTALAESLLDLDWPAVTSLRFLLTGGDRLRRAPRAGLPFTLVNNYGVTEASVVTTSGAVPPGTPAPTIGKAIAGVDVRVVDAALSPVPAGDLGELLVGGVSLGRGYLDAPGLTAQRFVVDANPELTGRWYRTGDLVRFRPDGELDYRGRLDDQVNVLGQRLEPAEVDAVLLLQPEIESAAVVAVGEIGASRLVACLVARGAARPPRSELTARLREWLPDYMVPVEYVWLETMPVTVGGKVDRESLRKSAEAGDTADPQPGDELTGAAADAAAIISAMVTELLDLPEVGVDDNFFWLGGHSLFGAQLITRMERRFGVELARRDVFDNPTVRSLTGLLSRVMVEQVSRLTEAETARLLAQMPQRG